MASDGTFCKTCGNPIVDENVGGDPSTLSPCPKCGDTARRMQLSAALVASHSTVTADLSVTTYPQILLSTAQNLFDGGQFEIAVVVAHMACEVATERSLYAASQRKGIQYLEEVMFGNMNGFSLGNKRNRKLYTTLTDDAIQTQPFWESYSLSAGRRNDIVHAGKIFGRSEAEKSLSAARSFVAHLNR